LALSDMEPASAVTSPSLTTSKGTFQAFRIRRKRGLMALLNSGFGMARKSEATMAVVNVDAGGAPADGVDARQPGRRLMQPDMT